MHSPPSSSFFPIILTDLNSPWEKVLNLGTPRSFPAKSIITVSDHGMSEIGMYYIRSGRVRLSSLTFDGTERIVLYMGKGTLFNELPMLILSSDHMFTCMEKTETVFLRKKNINEDFIKKNPELMLNLLISMGKKSKTFYSQFCNLRTLDTFSNVCHALYSMYLFNKINDLIVPRLTQQELASFLGVHRSSLHKALTRLKQEGIIGDYHRRKLIVFDEERLRTNIRFGDSRRGD